MTAEPRFAMDADLTVYWPDVKPCWEEEIWRPTTRHDCYEVSSHGRVRRVDSDRVLRPAPTNRGYLKVHLGARVQVYVHTLVCETFHGPRPPGHHVDHIDFDRTNNHATNLRWLHALENSVRWAGRTPDYRNIWATPDDVPEDIDETADLTDEEWARVEEAGW